MSSLRRRFTTSLQHTSPRRVAQSLPAPLSSAMSSGAITTQQSETFTIHPIFDIFDAPVRLEESYAPAKRRTETTRIVAPKCNGEKSRNVASTFARTHDFSSLPPPIVFDGPAHSAHLLPRALENCPKMQRRYPSPNRREHAPSSSFFTPSSQPVYEVFDGPSRISDHKYPGHSHSLKTNKLSAD